MLSSPICAIKPPHLSPLSAFSTDISINGIISFPSDTLNETLSGSQLPLSIQDQTAIPNAVSVAVFFVRSNDKAAGGWPRNPGMDNVTSILSGFSSHTHPSSLTEGTREVLSVPLEVMSNNSLGSGFSRSEMVSPKSDTSRLLFS